MRKGRFGRVTVCKMIWKIIILFLCGMALLAMVGKFLFPERRKPAKRRAVTLCNDCGRPLVGKSCGCKVKT